MLCHKTDTNHEEIMISSGKGKSNLVPCTCKTKILLATRIELSFLNIYSYS